MVSRPITAIPRWALLALVLFVVSLPRFNLQDPGLIKRFTASATATPYGVPLDVEGYRRLSEYFRGDMPADSMLAPFCFRPMVPALASQLPWSSQTSINLVNLLSLLLTVAVLDRVTGLLGFGSRARVAGSLLFIVSFPTFYYGTIGFVDPPCILLMAVGADWTLRGRTAWLALLVPVAVLVKETNAIIGLLPAIRAWSVGQLGRTEVSRSAGLLAVAAVTAVLVHVLSPFPEAGFIWSPDASAIARNLTRPRAWLSLLMTLGVPTILALAGLISGRTRSVLEGADRRFLLGGAALGFLLYLYSLTSAYADGRVIWIVAPFMIPLAMVWFERALRVSGMPAGVSPSESRA